MRLAQLLRLVRFGIVGLASAAVHYLVVVGLVELTYMHPLVANIIGFATSVWVSYFGHRHWTFGEHTTTSTSTSMMRFLATAVLGFCVNELLFYLLLHFLTLPYYVSLIIDDAIVAVMTYTLSHLWAFRARPASHPRVPR
ncbi:GtrA family protein [Undibacterium arcticum]|uniref:GtrA family protein n=1 Tax=Undibacterium arcticum TaxID=1762892 RepID=A0ABV7EXH5_9BURK